MLSKSKLFFYKVAERGQADKNESKASHREKARHLKVKLSTQKVEEIFFSFAQLQFPGN
jgi:hypothetical protein